MYSSDTNVGEMPVFLVSNNDVSLAEIIKSYPEPQQLYAVEGSSSMNTFFNLMLVDNKQRLVEPVKPKKWWAFWW